MQEALAIQKLCISILRYHTESGPLLPPSVGLLCLGRSTRRTEAAAEMGHRYTFSCDLPHMISVCLRASPRAVAHLSPFLLRHAPEVRCILRLCQVELFFAVLRSEVTLTIDTAES